MEINSRIHLANSMPALTLSHDSVSTQWPQLSLHDVFTKSRLPDPLQDSSSVLGTHCITRHLLVFNAVVENNQEFIIALNA